MQTGRGIRALVAAVIVLGGTDALAVTYGAHDGWADYVYHQQEVFGAGIHVAWTANASAGTDTVLHVAAVYPGGLVVPVASNDDCGSARTSCVGFEVDPSVHPTYTYLIIVHAYSNGTKGTAELVVDMVSKGQIGVNGLVTSLGGTTANSDEIETSLLPGGSEDTILLGLDAWGTLKAFDDDGGVERASKISGSFYKAVVGAYRSYRAGNVRLIVNDAGSDADGDGLGDALEKSLCTCPNQTDYSCSSTSPATTVACSGLTTAQDSDGDGLWDDWEVFGKDDTSDPQILPAWGADPRRKDLFLTLTRTTWPSETPSVAPIVNEEIFNGAAQLLRNLPSVKNPDGSNGIHLHVDRGQDCTDPALCGDWGHGDTIIPFQTGAGARRQHDFAQDPANRDLFFPAVRRGVFFWADVNPTGGGGGSDLNNPVDLDFGYAAYTSAVDRVYFTVTVAHEIGHALGLPHATKSSTGVQTPHGHPVYPSLIAYPFYSRGQAYKYASINGVGFSDGRMVDQDNLALDETKAVAPYDVDISYLETYPYFYQVDNFMKWVDWNRDGVFDGTVRAMMAPPADQWGFCGDQIAQNGSETLGEVTTTGYTIQSGYRQGQEVLYILDVPDPGVLRYRTTTQVSGGWTTPATIAVAPHGPRPTTGAVPAALDLVDNGYHYLMVFVPGRWQGIQGILQYTFEEDGTVRGPSFVAHPNGVAVNELSAVEVHRKGQRWNDVYLFFRDLTTTDNDARVQVGFCDDPPLCPTVTFSTLDAYDPDTGLTAPVMSKVTPGPAVGPDGRLYLLASRRAADGHHRLEMYKAFPDPESSLAFARVHDIRWLDELQGHAAGQLKRSVVDARPTMLLLPHYRGGSENEDGAPQRLTPLDDRGYFIAWWREGNKIRFALTEGMFDRIMDGFDFGNYRFLYAAGTVPTTSTLSATVFKQHPHLLTPQANNSGVATNIKHFPWADGLGPKLRLKADHDDGATMGPSLCPVLKTHTGYGSCSSK